MRSTYVSALLAGAIAVVPFAHAYGKSPKAPAKPPVAKKVTVTETIHGKQLGEDYRWMENSADPEVAAWTTGQNAYTRSVLDKIPQKAAIEKRVREIVTSRPAEYLYLEHRKAGIFAIKVQPPKQQAMLVLLPSADDVAGEKMLVDPNAIDPSGKTTIDFYAPSLDGKKVAVSMSANGTEDGTVYVWDTTSATKLGDVVPRVNGGTAGGSLTWNADASGFFYTRYPRGSERAQEDMAFYQQIWFHRLGTSTEQDTYAIGKDFPRIALCSLETSEDGKYVLAQVANGDGGEYSHYLFDGTKWTQFTKLSDRVVAAELGFDGAIYLLSRLGAPRGKILRMPLGTPELAKAKVIVPEGEATIQRYVPAATKLYVGDLLGGPSQIRVFGLDGKAAGTVPILPVSSVSQIVHLDGDAVLFRNASYVTPPAWFKYSPEDPAPKKTALVRTAVVDFSDTEVVREMATSKDGTKVPVNIIRRKNTKLDGSNPTLLYGYGGYSISLMPSFYEDIRTWIEQGGVYAVANIRGGGEFGDEWHLAGNLTKKQNCFDDFAAAAQFLISSGYTKPEKLALEGGSNGGLLMGAMITQHPEMFRAAVSYVGVYDMVRAETTSNGQFNTTEYGTVKDKAQFEALHAYSPYHHVVDGTAYPAVLFTSGANDPRVDPWHSRKMVARIQAATSSKRPLLLRTSEFGHGGGSSMDDRIAIRADAFAFLFNELGVKYTPVKSTPAKAAPKKT